jgi:hypothetical protein
MPRPLTRLPVLAATLVVALAGCVGQAPVEAPVAQPAVKVATPQVLTWLRWQESVSTMTEPQLATALEGMAKPENANQRFYYALLRQQANDYDSWVAARDIFRALQEDAAVAPGQRQLAGILERYNQSRINWFHSRDELRQQYEALQQQVTELQAQNSLLEQKIQAITELEATISTRKEE